MHCLFDCFTLAPGRRRLPHLIAVSAGPRDVTAHVQDSETDVSTPQDLPIMAPVSSSLLPPQTSEISSGIILHMDQEIEANMCIGAGISSGMENRPNIKESCSGPLANRRTAESRSSLRCLTTKPPAVSFLMATTSSPNTRMIRSAMTCPSALLGAATAQSVQPEARHFALLAHSTRLAVAGRTMDQVYADLRASRQRPPHSPAYRKCIRLPCDVQSSEAAAARDQSSGSAGLTDLQLWAQLAQRATRGKCLQEFISNLKATRLRQDILYAPLVIPNGRHAAPLVTT